jgi:hypothetical protein
LKFKLSALTITTPACEGSKHTTTACGSTNRTTSEESSKTGTTNGKSPRSHVQKFQLRREAFVIDGIVFTLSC